MQVYVSGSFNEWSAKIQMVKSTHNFYTIVDLPAGRHEYKFIVDGQWKSDPNQTIIENQLGSYNNVITVKPTDFQVRPMRNALLIKAISFPPQKEIILY